MWNFPLKNYTHTVPSTSNHPGSFGAIRKYDIHTGVDLYCSEGELVYPVELGTVVKIEIFTGVRAGSPWWEETWAVWVEGKTGLVVYGEINPHVAVGDTISSLNTVLGAVKRVLKKDKGLPTSMLHLELYNKHMSDICVWTWDLGKDQPKDLLDPTFYLINASTEKIKKLSHSKIHAKSQVIRFFCHKNLKVGDPLRCQEQSHSLAVVAERWRGFIFRRV